MACAINLGNTVIITGDRDEKDQVKVTEYSEAGFSRDLPPLQLGRYGHGCSYFDNDDGTTVADMFKLYNLLLNQII